MERNQKKKEVSSWVMVGAAIIFVTLFWMIWVGIVNRRKEPVLPHNATVLAKNEKDREAWQEYANKEFGFAIKYPPGWRVKERVGTTTPIISIYKQDAPESLAAPFSVRDNATHVSIYPRGDTLFKQETLGERLMRPSDPDTQMTDYLLYDKIPYATMLSFDRFPSTWKNGFVFMKVRTDGLDLDCLREGKPISFGECGSRAGDVSIRKGRISLKDRSIEEAILKTFHFTVD